MRYLVVLPLLLLMSACSNDEPPEPSKEIKNTLEKAESVEETLEEAQKAADEAIENASQ